MNSAEFYSLSRSAFVERCRCYNAVTGSGYTGYVGYDELFHRRLAFMPITSRSDAVKARAAIDQTSLTRAV